MFFTADERAAYEVVAEEHLSAMKESGKRRLDSDRGLRDGCHLGCTGRNLYFRRVLLTTHAYSFL